MRNNGDAQGSKGEGEGGKRQFQAGFGHFCGVECRVKAKIKGIREGGR
jgi:hypothetical protein